MKHGHVVHQSICCGIASLFAMLPWIPSLREFIAQSVNTLNECFSPSPEKIITERELNSLDKQTNKLSKLRQALPPQ